MRPVEHFFSRLRTAGPGDEAFLTGEFAAVAGPVLGQEEARAMAGRFFARAAASARDYERLGSIAAFLAGEYGGDMPPLSAEDWEDIRETLDDLSGEMPLDKLTFLMNELLERGKL